MIYFYRVSIFFFLLFVHYSCEEQHCHASQFQGISQTDINGGPLTSPDPDDWNFDDDWDKGLKNLFETDHETNCNPDYNYWIAAYPNPADNVFAIALGKDSLTSVDMRLVNFVCGTEFSIDGFTGDDLQIQVDNGGQSGIMRLYYKFIKDGCEFQGHGDILVY